MQFKKNAITASLVATSMAAYVPSGDNWTTLTPTATYSGGISNYASTFGIAVIPITTGSLAATSTSASVATSSTKAKRDVQAISQIAKSTAAAASQITDGQVQATTNTNTATTETTGPSSASSLTTSFTSSITPTGSTTTLAPATTTASNSTDPVEAQACKTNGTLSMTLNDGILKDSKDRIGSIVANRQFQFDGPPQAGAIYAKGWSITQEGNLAIGTEDVFYQCLSGDFYNLYDERIGGQCKAVHLEVIDLVSC
ncbi:uncharacterized protein SCDLUD_002408 [Saccharomycodes ludwigii]|uniref:uncharacterized protein n=1 Tax=Saccharomycodes ludwigii TaxID=36035 RepID=UPI001E847CE8|nr:hypothetical protein SCDLUD_002408 [Saccharomycodes ludwigii]KAH3900946.1 hypothetical protein SCDLUD_002408 [Saccharomycodes ludwigii]